MSVLATVTFRHTVLAFSNFYWGLCSINGSFSYLSTGRCVCVSPAQPSELKVGKLALDRGRSGLRDGR